MFGKSKINFWLAAVMLTDLFFLVLIGLIMHYVLPPGSGLHQGLGGGEAKTFLMLGRHDWGAAHWVLAVIFLSLLLAHLLLHWRWIWRQYKTIFRKNPEEGSCEQ